MLDILLATYNGEKYLEEQINSIISQSFKEWLLYINDDNSTDKTLEIIKKMQKIDKRIILLKTSENSLGVVGNFFKLLSKSKNDFIMFCDQDDIWKEKKIEKLLNQIKNCDQSKPQIVHCDSLVVNEKLNLINNSYIGKRGKDQGIEKMLFSANVQGLNMLMNRTLKEKIKGDSTKIHLHDFYISLINEVYGQRTYLSESLTYYRQHSKNVTGVKSKYQKLTLLKKYNIYDLYKNQIKTVKEFLKNYNIPKKEKEVIDAYLYILNEKKYIYLKIYKIFKYGFKSPNGKIELIFKLVISKQSNRK